MTASLIPNISMFDEVFDAGKSSQYRLTIQCAWDGLSYALLDTQSSRLIALECYHSEMLTDSQFLFRTLDQALEQKGLNNKAFLSVTCIYDERINTLIPEPIFNDADKDKYLEFAFQIPDGYAIHSEKMASMPCFNVFAMPNTLKEKVLARWGNATFTHSSTLFINSVTHDLKQETQVFVNVRSHDFDMVILKEGHLFFFNNFKYDTKEDFAYFLLFAMDQNGLSRQETTVQFSGLILPSSEIIDLCRHYVKNLIFVDDPHVLQVSDALKDVPFQYYYTLYHSLGHETRDQ